jgi:hypothetical protein
MSKHTILFKTGETHTNGVFNHYKNMIPKYWWMGSDLHIFLKPQPSLVQSQGYIKPRVFNTRKESRVDPANFE